MLECRVTKVKGGAGGPMRCTHNLPCLRKLQKTPGQSKPASKPRTAKAQPSDIPTPTGTGTGELPAALCRPPFQCVESGNSSNASNYDQGSRQKLSR